MNQNLYKIATKYIMMCLCGLFICICSSIGQDTLITTTQNAEYEDLDTIFAADTEHIIEENYNKYDADHFISEENLSEIYTRKGQINQDRWNKIVGNDNYKYELLEIKKRNEEQSALQSLIESIIHFFNSKIGYFISILIIAFIIIFVVFKMTKNKQFIFRNKVSNANNAAEADAFEFIPDNWQQAILDAIQRKDYKAAIAFQFRHLLVKLHEANLIQYEGHKTNMHYYYELIPSKQANKFQQLSSIFNEAKYGYKEIDKGSVNNFQEIDAQLQQLLNLK